MPGADLFPRTYATEPPDGDKGREERGSFYTPDALALAICRTLRNDCGILDPEAVFEPGCGGGAFVRAIHATWGPRNSACGGIWAVDLVPALSSGDVEAAIEQRDLFTCSNVGDLCVGNPDYAIAEDVVRHCLKEVWPKGHVAFLLRSAFLGGAGRVPLYREYPLRYFQPIAQRPSFTCDGKTDPMEYGLYVWMAGWKGRGEILPPLVWR